MTNVNGMKTMPHPASLERRLWLTVIVLGLVLGVAAVALLAYFLLHPLAG
jgi:hypothetical protein